MKIRRIVFIALALLISISFSVYADMGPKPSISITIQNPPDQDYVLDILQIDCGDNFAMDRASYYNKETHQVIKGTSASSIPPDILDKLSKYCDDNWTSVALYGERIVETLRLSKAGKSETFKYHGNAPGKIKVIVITADGDIKVSNILKCNSLNTSVTFDCKTGEAVLDTATPLIGTFLSTCILTLLIEGLFLLAFGFFKRRNIITAAITNISTQLLLYAAILIDSASSWALSYFSLLLISELAIFIIETIVYLLFFKPHIKSYIICYTLTANLVSCLAFDIIFSVIAFFILPIFFT